MSVMIYHRDGRLEGANRSPEYYRYPVSDFSGGTWKDGFQAIEEFDWVADLEESQDGQEMDFCEHMVAGAQAGKEPLEECIQEALREEIQVSLREQCAANEAVVAEAPLMQHTEVQAQLEPGTAIVEPKIAEATPEFRVESKVLDSLAFQYEDVFHEEVLEGHSDLDLAGVDTSPPDLPLQSVVGVTGMQDGGVLQNQPTTLREQTPTVVVPSPLYPAIVTAPSNSPPWIPMPPSRHSEEEDRFEVGGPVADNLIQASSPSAEDEAYLERGAIDAVMLAEPLRKHEERVESVSTNAAPIEIHGSSSSTIWQDNKSSWPEEHKNKRSIPTSGAETPNIVLNEAQYADEHLHQPSKTDTAQGTDILLTPAVLEGLLRPSRVQSRPHSPSVSIPLRTMPFGGGNNLYEANRSPLSDYGSGFSTYMPQSFPCAPKNATVEHTFQPLADLEETSGQPRLLGMKVDKAVAKDAAGGTVVADTAKSINHAMELELSGSDEVQMRESKEDDGSSSSLSSPPCSPLVASERASYVEPQSLPNEDEERPLLDGLARAAADAPSSGPSHADSVRAPATPAPTEVLPPVADEEQPPSAGALLEKHLTKGTKSSVISKAPQAPENMLSRPGEAVETPSLPAKAMGQPISKLGDLSSLELSDVLESPVKDPSPLRIKLKLSPPKPYLPRDSLASEKSDAPLTLKSNASAPATEIPAKMKQTTQRKSGKTLAKDSQKKMYEPEEELLAAESSSSDSGAPPRKKLKRALAVGKAVSKKNPATREKRDSINPRTKETRVEKVEELKAAPAKLEDVEEKFVDVSNQNTPRQTRSQTAPPAPSPSSSDLSEPEPEPEPTLTTKLAPSRSNTKPTPKSSPAQPERHPLDLGYGKRQTRADTRCGSEKTISGENSAAAVGNAAPLDFEHTLRPLNFLPELKEKLRQNATAAEAVKKPATPKAKQTPRPAQKKQPARKNEEDSYSDEDEEEEEELDLEEVGQEEDETLAKKATTKAKNTAPLKPKQTPAPSKKRKAAVVVKKTADADTSSADDLGSPPPKVPKTTKSSTAATSRTKATPSQTPLKAINPPPSRAADANASPQANKKNKYGFMPLKPRAATASAVPKQAKPRGKKASASTKKNDVSPPTQHTAEQSSADEVDSGSVGVRRRTLRSKAKTEMSAPGPAQSPAQASQEEEAEAEAEAEAAAESTRKEKPKGKKPAKASAQKEEKLEVRQTRRASAAQEEIERAREAERNIRKRLRSGDGKK
ncbi:hypothetical protein CC80DRAFT_542743 [Byssothecium circinans]|uniref:Uncharacterized protein n=1 Tax=Byssothecium circinans TaxID=147558 RepID=A0A6A5UBZ3_9PLEO|nr:hypothetical protein CC80DRAFT_542743 [Byssothecium circinans]